MQNDARPGALCFTPLLQGNTTITSLNLHGCKRISDKGVLALNRLPLRALSLGLTRIKDEVGAWIGFVSLATLRDDGCVRP